MEKIYNEAKKRGIKIYPFIKERLDNTDKNHILPLTKLTELTDRKFKRYLDALWNVHSYNAGGYNGWTTAHKIFEELGFEKKQIRRGHRVFESYSYKEKVEEIPQFKGTHKELDKIICEIK